METGNNTLNNTDNNEANVSYTSCFDANKNGAMWHSGSHTLKHDQLGSIEVFCDFDSDGGLGYTTYAVTDGITSDSFASSNSCPDGNICYVYHRIFVVVLYPQKRICSQ